MVESKPRRTVAGTPWWGVSLSAGLLLALVSELLGCGLEYLPLVQKPDNPAVNPFESSFSFQCTVDDYALLEPYGYELYYKFYPSLDEQSATELNLTTRLRLQQYGFRRLCSDQDMDGDERLPLIRLQPEWQSATVQINFAVGFEPTATVVLADGSEPGLPVALRRGVVDPEDLDGRYKEFGDIAPSDADFSQEMYDAVQQGTALVFALYAITYGTWDFAPQYSDPVYLGSIQLNPLQLRSERCCGVPFRKKPAARWERTNGPRREVPQLPRSSISRLLLRGERES